MGLKLYLSGIISKQANQSTNYLGITPDEKENNKKCDIITSQLNRDREGGSRFLIL